MALNIAATYPANTTPPNVDYPVSGSGKDATSPGAQDGTPLKKLVFDDVQGLLQGLLLQAGINPSNVPDTAILSQYVQAIGRICGRSSTTTDDILTGDYTEAESIATSGYATTGDGGHALWYATGVTTPGNAGTTAFSSSKIYDSKGNEFEVRGNLRNPRWFGAKGDNSTDDTTAIQAATTSLVSTGGVVFFDAGTYLCDSPIILVNGVIFRGESADRSVISFDGAGGVFSNGFCIFAQGAVSGISALSADVAAGDNALAFTGAHGLSVDEVFVILDPTNSSLSPAQTYYRAGEMVRVGEVVDPTNVVASRGLFAGYVAATVDLAKVISTSVGFESLTVRGLGTDTTTGCIGIRYGRDCYVRNVRLRGTQADSALDVSRCYGVEIDDVDGLDLENFGTVGRHMVGVWNSQHVRARGLRGVSSQAFLATGGKDAVWSPPCRDVLVSDSHVDNTVDNAASVHIGGDTEFWRVADCTLGGVTMGGDLGTVEGCTLYGTGPDGSFTSGAAVTLDEAHGLDLTVQGCTILATRNTGPNVALVHLDDPSASLNREGTIRLAGCRIDMRGFSGLPVRAAVRSLLAGAVARFDMSACVCRGPTNVVVGTLANGADWRSVSIRSCDLKGTGINVQGAEEVDIVGCQIFDAPAAGILINGSSFVTYALQRVSIQACTIRRSQLAGISISDTTATALVRAVVANTESTNNNQSGAVGAVGLTYTSVHMQDVFTGIMQGCVVGNDTGSTQLATYSAEDVVSLLSADAVTLGAGLEPDFVGTVGHQAWATRQSGTDEAKSTGSLGLQGGVAALAGVGASGLIIGDGGGNQGMTLRASTAGVSRFVAGDSNNANLFELQGDHAARVWNFLVNGGRDLRLFEDAAELGKVYADDTDGDGGFNVNIWSNGTAVNSGSHGGPFASGHRITQTVAGGVPLTGQVTYTFPEAYDQAPYVFLEGFGVEASGWTKSTVTTTTAIFLFAGTLDIADITGFDILVVGRR